MFRKRPLLTLCLVLVSLLVASTSPESPPRSLFRPRNRFPVHFKATDASTGLIRQRIENRLNSNRFSSTVPAPTEVTPPNVKPTVRIFTIGSTSTQPVTSVVSSTFKSLLDDTEPLNMDDLVTPTKLSEDESKEGEDNEDMRGKKVKELEGQESIYFGVTPTVATYTPSTNNVGRRVRPPLIPTQLIPIAPRQPMVAQTPLPVAGPSPLVTTVQVHAPTPTTGSPGARSLFNGQSAGVGRPREHVRDNVNLSPVDNDDDNPDVITDFLFSDIKCFRTKQKEYFGAKIHLKSGFSVPPYIRDRPDDPLTSSECQLEPSRDSNTYQMKMTDLRGCGVEQCGDSMCITMVFPRMPNLALADDEVTTIKCMPQRSSMAETKSISFIGDSLDKRRSGSTVEGGGQEFAAEVGIFRQSPGTSNGLFVKRVNSGGVVQLGEPLQLRSVVRGGDGWTFSKLTDVKVWRMRESFATFTATGRTMNPNDASEVITLVDEKGCRNEEFRVITDSNPLRDPRNDLVHHFTFKAFLFRSQRSNEPLILTAKVQACQERDDCDFTECSVTRDRDHARYKRSLPHKRSNSSSMNWDSQLALRVIGLNDVSLPHEVVRSSALSACANQMGVAAAVASFITVILAFLVHTLVSLCRRGRKGVEGTDDKVLEAVRHRQVQRSVSSDFVRYPVQTISAQQPSLKSLTTQNHSTVSHLLQQLGEEGPHSQRHLQPDNGDDGVYVVYYKRSRSVPGSLREKVTTRRGASTDVDESDEDPPLNFDRPRQTVRTVKKRSQGRQKFRARKEIPYAYRQSVAPSHHGSTTSIRIGGDDIASKNVNSTSYLQQFTTSPSTHFVTRNDSSTQIVIIPETNV